jgi:hypothetical protein
MKIRTKLIFIVSIATVFVGCVQKEVVDLRTKRKVSNLERIKVIEQQVKEMAEVSSEDVAYLDDLKSSIETEMSEDLNEPEEQPVEESLPIENNDNTTDDSSSVEAEGLDQAGSEE